MARQTIGGDGKAPFRVKATAFGPEWEGWKRKFLLEGQRFGLRVAGVHWHKVFRPRHFEHYAPMKYGYRRRSRYSEGMKQRWGDEPGPLSFSGELRRMSGDASFSVWGKRARVAMAYPSYAEMDRRHVATQKDLIRWAEFEWERFSGKPLEDVRKWMSATRNRRELLRQGFVPNSKEDFLKVMIADLGNVQGAAHRKYNRWFTYPDIKAEMTRTVPDEVRVLGDVLKKEMKGYLLEREGKAKFKKKQSS